ncbi:MAG: phospholipase D-like domain-containing protein [archaeon]
MRPLTYLLGALFFLSFGVGVGLSYVQSSSPLPDAGLPSSFSGIRSAFCPSPACIALPLEAIEGSHSRVWVAMYSFTNESLAAALVQAHDRGVDVRVVVEKQQAGGSFSQHDELSAAGVPVRIDTNPSLMHHKFAIVDDSLILTGSMNWTGNGVGENNENLLSIASGELNQKYADEFDAIWNDSLPYSDG